MNLDRLFEQVYAINAVYPFKWVKQIDRNVRK